MTTTAALTDQRSVVRRLIEASARGDADAARTLVTEDVVGWSPTLRVNSRDEFIAQFAERTAALSEVEVTVDRIDASRDRVAAEWHMTAKFTGPLELDEITIPPNGHRIELAGATFADLAGERIRSFHHYFDDAALIEQLLALS